MVTPHHVFRKRYYEKNKEKGNARSRAYYAANRNKIAVVVAKRHSIRKYGITLEERDHMLASQGGVCAACRSPSPGSKRGWHTDHDHTTKRVRAILCHWCDTTLGAVREDPEHLRRLIACIERQR